MRNFINLSAVETDSEHSTYSSTASSPAFFFLVPRRASDWPETKYLLVTSSSLCLLSRADLLTTTPPVLPLSAIRSSTSRKLAAKLILAARWFGLVPKSPCGHLESGLTRRRFSFPLACCCSVLERHVEPWWVACLYYELVASFTTNQKLGVSWNECILIKAHHSFTLVCHNFGSFAPSEIMSARLWV